jgi:hypothetical protein
VDALFSLDLPGAGEQRRMPGAGRQLWILTYSPSSNRGSVNLFFRVAVEFPLVRTCRQGGTSVKRPVRSLEDVNYKMKLGNMALILNSCCALPEVKQGLV